MATTTMTPARTATDRSQVQVSRSTLARTMDGIIEGCWLLAVIAAPFFFNINSRRVFEPDKITVVRNLVIIMVIALIVKGIEAAPRLVAWTPRPAPAGGALSTLVGRTWRTYPLLIPVALFVVIYIVATITSIDPSISFWGSYERLQGTYTWLTYITMFLLMITHIRRWQQLERIISAAIFTSMPIAFYGVLQHYHIDPLPWGGDVFSRVASTMGNAIFLGAYLLMVVPFTIYRICLQIADLTEPPPPAAPAPTTRAGRRAAAAPVPAWRRRRARRNGMIMLGVYLVALLLELLATLYTYSRGPFGGLVIAIIAFGVIAGLRYHLRWLAGTSIGLLVLGLLVLAAANSSHPLIHGGPTGIGRLVAVTSSESGTTEVRQLIWKGSETLIKERPILGWGPETMLLAYNPVYPPALGHIEQANASPDRNHDEEMDFLVMSGVLGLLAYLGILLTFFWMASHLVRRMRGLRESLLAIALVAIVIGHIGEGLTGIAIVSTLVMLWTAFAIASVLFRMAPELAASSATPGTPGPEMEAAPAAGTGRAARQGGTRSGTGTAQRRAAAASRATWEHLTGGRMIAAMAGAGLGVVAIGALLVLFFANYQVVAADVVFKDALNYEQAATTYSNQGHNLLGTTQTQGAAQTVVPTTTQQQATQNFNASFQYFNQAILLFQQSISEQPSQDFYYLYYGKTLLEKVQADRDTNNTGWRDQDILQAKSILLQAYHLNPLDTDHSANLGRLYSIWAQWDPSQYPLALQWFDRAIRLSPHNSRLITEYGASGALSYGQYLAGIGKKAQATAMYHKAAGLFKQAATVDPQLSEAFARWGDVEFVPIFLNNGPASIYPYLQALKLTPAGSGNVPAIDTNLSIAYYRDLKDYKKAQAYATQAMTAASALLKSTPPPSQSTYQQLQATYNQAYSVFTQASAVLKTKKK